MITSAWIDNELDSYYILREFYPAMAKNEWKAKKIEKPIALRLSQDAVQDVWLVI